MGDQLKLTKEISLVALISLVLFGSLVWVRAIGFPDLPKYADIARMMVQNGNYVTPYFNGVKEFSEPPLYYWLQALVISAFGFSFSLLRLISVFAAVFGCVMTYYTTLLCFGQRCARISTAILASNALYFTYSQTVAPYMLGGVLLSACFMCYVIASDSDGRQKTLAYLFFWIFSALSTLTIGLAGLLLPLISMVIWGCVFNYWRFLSDLFKPLNIAIYCLITVPWFLIAQHYNPDFFYFYFIEEHFFKIYQNLAPANSCLFVIPLALLALLPWSTFIAQSLWTNWPKTWADRDDHIAGIYLMITCFLVLLHIALTGAKMGWLIALAPSACILIGRYVDLIWDRTPLAITKFNFEILFLIALCSLSLLVGISYLGWFHGSVENYHYLRLLTVILLLIMLIALPIIRYARFPYAFLTLFIGAIICFNTLVICYPHVGGNITSLVDVVKPNLNQHDVIVSYGQFYDELTVLFKKPIVAVNWEDRPAYGKKYQNTTAWVVEPQTLWHYWNLQDKRFYMFIPQHEYSKLLENKASHLYYLASSGDNVLISNIPV